MFGWLLGLAFAEVPQESWSALEREMAQLSIVDESAIQSGLAAGCNQKHKSSCQWSKKRQKGDESIDTWMENRCQSKKDPWACVGYGWTLSQRPKSPGIPYRLSDGWDEATDIFTQVCEKETRGCVELARLELSSRQEVVRTQAVTRLKTACDNGDLEGCYSYAVLMAEGVEIESDTVRATTLFEDGCAANHAKSCTQVALIQLVSASDMQGAKKAIDSYLKGCELGSTDACRGLAQHYEEGLGVDIDYALAGKYYQLACESHHAEACDKLGILYSEGRGVAEDLQKAADLFQRSCDSKNPFACYNLAALLEREGELPRALSLLSFSCVYESGRGCFTYGLWLEQGKVGDIDLDTAFEAYGKGCTLEYGMACVNGGILAYRAGRLPEALQMYRTGCELGDGDKNGACASYAMMMETGEAGDQNLDLARDLYQRSCTAGDQNACGRYYQLQGTVDELTGKCRKGDYQACYDAAQRYERGQLAIQNQNQALELVDFACVKGHQRSCVKLGYYYLQGIGVDVNTNAAHHLFANACTKKDAKGCHSLGLMYAEGRHVEQDIQMAVKMLSSACEMGEGSSCGATAYLVRTQNPPDFASSLTYSQKGCRLGNLDACAQEAFIYTQPPRTNLKQAALLFKENCSRNHAKSCFNYAAMLHQGQGVNQNPKEALRVMNHACILGDTEACGILAR